VTKETPITAAASSVAEPAAALRPADLQFLTAQRVARLATVDEAGGPHVLPVCFAVLGGWLYVPVDAKPKRGDPRQLARLRHLRKRPEAAFLCDEYQEDWTRLRWLLIRARARILEAGPERTAALAALERRYPQYAAMRLAELDLPVIALDPTTIRRWTSSAAWRPHLRTHHRVSPLPPSWRGHIGTYVL